MGEEKLKAMSELDAILAKDDTEIMLDRLRELFGADLDVDSRFTIAQVLTAMEDSHKQAVEFCQMVERAKAAAAARTPSLDREVVEAVARALCKVNFDKKGCEGEFGSVDDCWFAFADEAQAALSALQQNNGGEASPNLKRGGQANVE